MNYNYNSKKAVVVLSSTIESSIALNVTGHLCISLGANIDDTELMGQKEIYDKSDKKHIGISRYPVITTKLKPSKLKTFIQNVKENYQDIFIVDYPLEMLETGHDEELVEALKNINNEDIIYYGALIYGDTEIINQLTGKFSLWR